MSESIALSTVKPFNDLAGRAAAKGSEMLSLIWQAGETAKKAKAAIRHGEWLKFVDTHYDVSHDTVTRWIKFHETVPESKLRSVRNLSAGLKMIEDTKKKPTDGKKESAGTTASETDTDGSKDAAGETDEIGGFIEGDRCANCGLNAYLDDGDGEGLYCARCKHPVSANVDSQPVEQRQRETTPDPQDDNWSMPGETTISGMVAQWLANPVSTAILESVLKQHGYQKARADRKRINGMDIPTEAEVADYCQSKGYDIDAEEFLAHYDSVGWRHGRGNGKPVKSWRACCTTWEKTRLKALGNGKAVEV